MYYLGELARKPCTRQEVLGSNHAGCKKFFSVWDILSRFCHPGQKPPAFCPGRRVPVPKPGQMTLWNRDKRLFCSSEYMLSAHDRSKWFYKCCYIFQSSENGELFSRARALLAVGSRSLVACHFSYSSHLDNLFRSFCVLPASTAIC